MTDGLSGAGFDIDLAEAQVREGALAAILGANGNRLEIKYDKICRHTGNLFVEFKQHGRPSGIAISKAEWWAFEYDDDRWLIIGTEPLKKIARKAYADGRRAKGGDYNQYDGVLVPIAWLTPPCHFSGVKIGT